MDAQTNQHQPRDDRKKNADDDANHPRRKIGAENVNRWRVNTTGQ